MNHDDEIEESSDRYLHTVVNIAVRHLRGKRFDSSLVIYSIPFNA